MLPFPKKGVRYPKRIYELDGMLVLIHEGDCKTVSLLAILLGVFASDPGTPCITNLPLGFIDVVKTCRPKDWPGFAWNICLFFFKYL